jgi:hypothetical protein
MQYAKRGAKLVTIPGVIKDESVFFESSNYQAAKNEVEELSRIPKNDPYRIERQNMLTVGGDLRFFYIQQNSPTTSQKLKDGTFFPMAFDVGVRVRPTKKNLSLVYEGRALNFNAGSQDGPASIDKLFGPSGQAITRSAYILVDDLWYNSYAQYGFGRPMYGLYNPNHNAMMADYTGLGFLERVKFLGVGTAPNVPFGIFNLIMPTEGVASGIAAEEGINATLGLRFVRFGAHAQFSYWDTADEDSANIRKRTMWNINLGAVLINRRLILNGELNNIRRESISNIDEIRVLGVDGRFRFWREFYLQASFSQANGAIDLDAPSPTSTGFAPGSGTELAFGLRTFLISGIDLELMSASKTNKEDGAADFKEDTMTFQIHAYF